MSRAAVGMAFAVGVLAALVSGLLLTLQSDASSPNAAYLGRHPARPPFLLFRSLNSSSGHGHVSLLSLRAEHAPRQVTHLACDRLHYAGGRGLCIVQEAQGTAAQHVAYVFDRTFQRGQRIVLRGVPTRVRVAPNGDMAAITTFAEEESSTGERLATDTVVVRLPDGALIADLRQFSIHSKAQPPAHPIDVTGLAFERDRNRFFAGVSSGTEHYLVAGSLDERRMTIVRPGVASESLSPNERYLAVKKLKGAEGFWQLAVIDLRTWDERELAQGERSVDDQVEWVDNDHVVYHGADGNTTSLWMLPIDGVNGPRVFVKDAYSAAIQR